MITQNMQKSKQRKFNLGREVPNWPWRMSFFEFWPNGIGSSGCCWTDFVFPFNNTTKYKRLGNDRIWTGWREGRGVESNSSIQFWVWCECFVEWEWSRIDYSQALLLSVFLAHRASIDTCYWIVRRCGLHDWWEKLLVHGRMVQEARCKRQD